MAWESKKLTNLWWAAHQYISDMVERFLAHLSFLVVLNILIKPFYVLVIEVNVQNSVGEIYGLYFALLNMAYLLQIINDFGMQIFNSRSVAMDVLQIARLFRALLRLKLVLALLFLASLVVLAITLGHRQSLLVVIPIGVNLILVSMIFFLRSNISGLKHFRADAAFSIMDKALMIILCGSLLLFLRGQFNIYYFIFSQTASLSLTAVIAGIYIFKYRPPSAETSSTVELKPLLKKILPYAVGVFLMTVYTRIDAVMIDQLAENPNEQNALYAAGYRLLDALNMMAFLFATILLPMFSSLLNHRSELVQLAEQAFRYMWTLVASVACIGWFFRADIITILYPASSDSWPPTFGILILSFMAVGAMYVFGTFLTASGRIHQLNRIYMAGVVTNLVANGLMVPAHGAWGAAVATLATQGLVALALIWSSRRSLAGLWRQSLLLKLIGFTVSIFGLTWLIQSYLGSQWAFAALLSCLSVVAAAVLLQVVRISDLRSAFRQ